ncbi:MAG: hypothetical protein HOQ44_03820, partial [Nocardia sp.]|nr:hypothetical protein [Nocardia sp.]
MVATLAPQAPSPDAVIFDYNGVIGRQPTALAWRGLAELAGWPADRLEHFQSVF